MKVAILGGGVLGVTTAWYLAKSGHEVTVIDRQNHVAEETSYANAGMISPGYSSPWAAPGVPFKAIGWMLQDLSPFMVNMKELDGYTLSWMCKMLANCNTKSYQTNKARMLRVAEYSRDCFVDLRKELNLNYDGRQKGTLQLFRKQKQIDALQKDIAVLKQLGIPHQALDMQGCIEHEPALAHAKEKFVGGLRLPGDETGDCYKFTTELAAQCEALGVTFMLNTNIEHLVESKGKIVSVKTDKGVVKADTFVCALGSYSPKLMKPLGIDLPIYPIKGYSLTLPIEDESRAPHSTIMDETYKVAVTRFEDRIRVGGTAEISSFNLDLPMNRRASLDFVIQDMFPGATNIVRAEFWCGLRPMTPDSTPILGGTKYSNLFMNTGHGTLGWTMSLGSAKFVADIINNKQPDIDPEGLSIERYYG